MAHGMVVFRVSWLRVIPTCRSRFARLPAAAAALVLAALPGRPAAGEGRPLFYWGARPPLLSVPAPDAREPAASEEARVVELHAAQDERGLVLRFTFDRAVAAATHLADGTPVSGRLRPVVYFDSDGERASGWRAGASDLRSGADSRLEIGVLSLGADPEEHVAAQAVITATLHALDAQGRRRTLWRGDDSATPDNVSARGEWLEVRLPAAVWRGNARARLVLAAGGQVLDARLKAP
jgi:hypothetical protein